MKQLVIVLALAVYIVPLTAMENDQEQLVEGHLQGQPQLQQFVAVDAQPNRFSCCTPEASQMLTKAGKGLFFTGLGVKAAEFALFSCCFQNEPVRETCRVLWFPACRECDTTLGCCALSWEWGMTMATFTGPLLWIAGALMDRKQENAPIQMDDHTVNN
jgi:hypothetical protein